MKKIKLAFLARPLLHFHLPGPIWTLNVGAGNNLNHPAAIGTVANQGPSSFHVEFDLKNTM